MISKKNRLPYAGLRSTGYRTLKSPFFSLKFKNNQMGINKMAVIVGKSVDKRATRRNFLKRQVKSQFLKIPKSAGKDIVVIISPKANLLAKKDFNQELRTAFEKIGN